MNDSVIKLAISVLLLPCMKNISYNIKKKNKEVGSKMIMGYISTISR